MPVRRTRSRDGATTDPIRRPRTISQDSMTTNSSHADDCEPLLSQVEAGERPRISPSLTTPKSTLHIATSPGIVESLSLPSVTSLTKTNSRGSSSSHTNNSNPFLRGCQQVVANARHNPDAASIATAFGAWFLVGVLAICTTKLLLTLSMEEGGVPSPLVLTFQQMLLGSNILRMALVVNGTLQPWPREEESNKTHPEPVMWWKPTTYIAGLDYLLLAGLFNGLDFLASNTSFSHSSATFVETIKASEPITTTALAIWWGIDRLGKMETLSLTLLITGVLMSTYANAMATTSVSSTSSATITEDVLGAASDDGSPSLADSIKTCLTIMTANLCFAFRAMCQKLLRSSSMGSAQNLDDFNLLCRMQQTGAASLLGPVLLFQHTTLLQVLFGRPSWYIFGYYVGLSLVNAWAFATYSLASCYILSRISVVQHSGFGCLRRMFAIVATSIAFGVPISMMGALGILLCVVGFSGFTHFRFQRQGQSKKDAKDEENDNDKAVDMVGTADKSVKGFGSTNRVRSSSGVETAPLSSGSSSCSEDLENRTHPI